MKKRMVILIVAVILLSGCEEYATYTPSAADLTTIAERMPEGPTKDAVQATAVARYQAAMAAAGTIDAAAAQRAAAQAQLNTMYAEMTREAQSTVAAQAVIAQGTSQALDARATSQALDVLATRQAADVLATATASAYQVTATAEARLAQATATAVQATRDSVSATSTAESVRATATMQSAIDNAELTRVAAVGVAAQATAQAIERENEIAENRKVLTTWGGYGALFIFLAGLGAIVYMLLPSIAARLGAIPRDARGDPPVMVLAARGALGGITVLDLPKLWSGATIVDSQVKQPLLTSTLLQDAQSKRADFINLVKGGRPRPIVAMPKAMGAPAAGSTGEQWVEDQESPPVQWPSRVLLPELFGDQEPSLNHLVVGVYPQPDGRQAVVGASLHQLMHVLTVGASGWGKSVWLRSLLWQLAQVREPVAVIAVDVNGSEFNMLNGWARLQYPVARSMQDAIATLRAVSDEIERRKELYERYPLAAKLPEYNRLSGDLLPPWVVVIDEGTNLLNERGIGDPLREVVQTARQYGVYLVLAGQSADHKVIPTQVRDNFSTRLCFKTSPTSSRVVLDDNRAGDLVTCGRAWVQLTGKELLQIQAPYVGRMELLPLLERGDVAQLPESAQVDERDPREQQVINLLESEPDMSDSAIARVIYGYENGRVRDVVREIRERTDGQNGRTG